MITYLTGGVALEDRRCGIGRVWLNLESNEYKICMCKIQYLSYRMSEMQAVNNGVKNWRDVAVRGRWPKRGYLDEKEDISIIGLDFFGIHGKLVLIASRLLRSCTIYVVSCYL